MMLYEWRVSLLDGKQSVRLAPEGIWIGETIFRWSDLSDVGFKRYQTRGGLNEELSLAFGDAPQRTLRWTGYGRNRAAWREMLVAFAGMAARQRPDLDLRDGPDARESRTARWIGLGVVAMAVIFAVMLFAAAEALAGYLVGAWIGVVGSIVGGLIYGHYSRIGPPPRLDWASFAAREGREGELPAN